MHFPAQPAGTAPAPPEARGLARDEVRLLVAAPDRIVHTRFHALAGFLEPGDLVVVNDSATEARAVDGVLTGRGPVVVHLATRLDRRSAWVVELRTAPDASRSVLDAAVGDEVVVGEARLRLTAPYPRPSSSPTGTGNRLWRADVVVGRLDRELRGARPIAYGYLDRAYPLEKYQSVFATRPGSAEMASAGRPFSCRVLDDLRARGVGLGTITLHTGVSSQEAGEGPQPEWFEVPARTAAAIRRARDRGGRVVAVGTTATRALESAVHDGRVRRSRGWTTRVVTPSHPPAVVDGLITGWHDPHASHLLLVEAVAGAELAQRAYDAAVAGSYLWHEFGDSGLFLPERRDRPRAQA